MRKLLYRVAKTACIAVIILGCAMPAWALTGLRDQSVDLVILLDRSGSMKTIDPDGHTVAAAAFVIEQLGLANDRNRVAVIPFSDKAFVLGQSPDKTNSATALQRPSGALIEMLSAGVSKGSFAFREARSENPSKLLSILRSQMKLGQNTHLLSALQMARKILHKASGEAQKSILLISDGTPDIMSLNKTALRALAGQLGYGTEQLRNIRAFNQKYSDYILKTEAPAIGRNGIDLIPVSFQKDDKRNRVIDQYLQNLRKKVNGDEEIFKADAANLISGLIEIIPSGSNHIALRQNRQFVPQGGTGGELDLAVPEVSLQTRFFLGYSEATASQVPHVRIFRNGALLADSSAPDNYGSTVFRSLRKKNGGLVYQSITITDANQASGNFRIEVGNSQGSSGVPLTALYVDIRSRLYPRLEFGQEPVCSPERLDLQLTLFDERQANIPVVMKVEAAQVSLRRLGTMSPIVLDTQVNEGGIVTSRLEEGLRDDGDYRLEADLCFVGCRDPDPQNRIAVRFRYDLPVASCATPQLWVGRKNSTQPEQNLRIELPPLGETMLAESSAYEVRTDFNGVLPRGITVSIVPPRHQERSDRELISGGVNWAKVKPSELRGNIFQRGAPLAISIEIPKKGVPSTLPDGLYTSELEIRQSSQTLASVPLVIPVRIPRFITNKDQANTPFDPDDAPPPSIIEQIVRYPGDGLHFFKVGLWSSSLNEVETRGSFGENGEQYGIKVYNHEESGERAAKVVFGIDEDIIPIPGKNSSGAGIIRPWVRIDDPSLDGQSFSNTLYISGPRHRPQQIRLLVKLQFIPAVYLQGAYLLLLLLAVFFGWRWWRMWRCRSFFVRNVNSLRFVENRPENMEIKYGGRSLGEWRYDGSDFPEDDESTPVVLNAPNGTCRRDEEQITLSDDEYSPQVGDMVTFGRNRQAITINILALPEAGRPLKYRVTRAPFGRGRFRYVLLAATFLLGIAGSVGMAFPYLLLQLVRW